MVTIENTIYIGSRANEINIYTNHFYHLKIRTNRDYEVLIKVKNIFVSINKHDDDTVTFDLLANTYDLGEWREMTLSRFQVSNPIDVTVKDFPLFLNWQYHSPLFYEILKGV